MVMDVTRESFLSKVHMAFESDFGFGLGNLQITTNYVVRTTLFIVIFCTY